MKLLTDLQNLDCELHKNVFGGRTCWGSYSAPPGTLAVIRGKEGGKKKEMVGVGNREREEREGRKRREGVGSDENGEGKGMEGAEGGVLDKERGGGLDLDICPEAPEFLVTPLLPGSK